MTDGQVAIITYAGAKRAHELCAREAADEFARMAFEPQGSRRVARTALIPGQQLACEFQLEHGTIWYTARWSDDLDCWEILRPELSARKDGVA